MPKSLPGADHGPKFRKLDVQQRQQLARMHHNLGHPDAQILGMCYEIKGGQVKQSRASKIFTVLHVLNNNAQKLPDQAT